MVTWFEIPVIDMSRAKVFYEKVFGIQLRLQKMDGIEMGWFPNKNEPGISTGTLILAGDHYEPSDRGVLVYFSCDDVANEIDRVVGAGGEVIKHKTQISEENGFMAYFMDSEGNRIALHSMK